MRVCVPRVVIRTACVYVHVSRQEDHLEAFASLVDTLDRCRDMAAKLSGLLLVSSETREGLG
jgi:hypothetical protein